MKPVTTHNSNELLGAILVFIRAKVYAEVLKFSDHIMNLRIADVVI